MIVVIAGVVVLPVAAIKPYLLNRKWFPEGHILFYFVYYYYYYYYYCHTFYFLQIEF